MSKNRITLVFGLAALFVGALVYGHARMQNGQGRNTFRQQDIYEHLFRHYIHIKRRAEEAEQQGRSEDARQLRAHYRREARLSEREADILDQVASNCMSSVDELSARAQQIITEARARVPGGRLQPRQTPPPPPAELPRLQQQREAIVLEGRERLRQEFGEEGFARFDEFVQRNIAGNMRDVTPREHLHRPRERGSGGPDLNQGGRPNR